MVGNRNTMLRRVKKLIPDLRRKDFKPLQYSSDLSCADCHLPALIKYFIGRCGHVVCVFCKPTHVCNINSS